MVFESIVAELLNKYLGSFVESLDSSQLSLGIFGGTVQLENLAIREEALVELGLPILVKKGHLRKLDLKIPWKNLYRDPVEVSIDGVYVLAQPTHATKYDAKKDKESKRKKKKEELLAIEQAHQRALEEKDEAKKKEKDGFAVKLAMQVIRNVQVSITDIHIRYEDPISIPGKLLSYGVTLEKLAVQTTDMNWKPKFVTEESAKFWKIVDLSCLSAYCDIDGKSLVDVPTDKWEKAFSAMIPRRRDKVHPPHQYLVSPISAEAHLAIDKNAGSDPNTPQVDVSMNIHQVAIGLSKGQFHSSIVLVEQFDRMATNLPYRKYKPAVSLKADRRAWWNYAMNSVMKEEVQPRLRQWSWAQIKNHRGLVRRYEAQWKVRLSQKDPSKSVQSALDSLEDELDVFNITLARQRADAQVKRETGEKAAKKAAGGWFGGLFGGGGAAAKNTPTAEEKEAQAAKEREKLYAALDYVEGERPGDFPPAYVARKFSFQLGAVSFALVGDNGENVTKLLTREVSANLGQRPGANAISVEASVSSFQVSTERAVLVSSHSAKSVKMLQVEFDKNPMNSIADMRVKLVAQPLRVDADLESVFEVVKFFDRADPLDLHTLSATATSQLKHLQKNLRDAGKAELSYALEKRQLIDLDILVHAPVIVIPDQRNLKGGGAHVVVDLGNLKLWSKLQASTPLSGADLNSISIDELEEQMYDRFSVSLEKLQVIVAGPGDDWKAAQASDRHPLHLLHPVSMDLGLEKSLTDKSTRLPLIKVNGAIPRLHVHASDYKLKQIFQILESIPKPPARASAALPSPLVADTGLPLTRTALGVGDIMTAVALVADEEDNEEFLTPEARSSPEEMSLQTSLDITKFFATFNIKEVSLTVAERMDDGSDKPRVDLAFESLSATVSQREFDLSLAAKVGELAVRDPTVKGVSGDSEHLYILRSDPGTDLIDVKLTKAVPDGPNFASKFQTTETGIDVILSAVHITAHQDSLVNLMMFANTLQDMQPKIPALEDSEKEEAADQPDATPTALTRLDSVRSIEQSEGFVKMRLQAKLPAVSLLLASSAGILAQAEIKGISSAVVMKTGHLNVAASLSELNLTDPTPGTLHSKILGLAEAEQKVLDVEFDKFENATSGGKAFDMSNTDMAVKLSLGCLQFVFVNSFLKRLLTFAKALQVKKELLDRAREAAVSASTASVEALSKMNADRVRLEVDIDAPVILVPESVNSNHVLRVSLGCLKLRNKFERLGDIVHPGNGSPCVLDSMSVSLTDVFVARMDIVPGGDGGATADAATILKRISLDVGIQRNLSQWHEGIPDVAVTCNIKPVQAQVCKADVDFALALLDGLLKEGLPGSEAPGESNASAESSSAGVVDKPANVDDAESSDTVPESSDKINVQLSMKLEEVSLTVLETVDGVNRPRLFFQVAGLSTGVTVTPWHMTADAALNFVAVKDFAQKSLEGGPMEIVVSEREKDLLKVAAIVAKPEGPEFLSKFQKIKTKLGVGVSGLHVNAHLETLVGLQEFVYNFLPEKIPGSGEIVPALPAPSEGEDSSKDTKPTESGELPADAIDLCLKAELAKFSVTVSRGDAGIACLDVGGVFAEIVKSPQTLSVQARLHSLEVGDLHPGVAHPKILSTSTTDDVLSLQFDKFEEEIAGSKAFDLDLVHMAVKLSTGRMQFVFVNAFLQRLLAFAKEMKVRKEILDSAREAAISASAASVEAMSKMNADRIRLVVDVHAPVVLVPESSTSNHVLEVSLGYLKVRNMFEHHSGVVHPETGSPCVVDNMSVSLTDVFVSRSVIGSQEAVVAAETGSGSYILKRISAGVHIRRNLSPWHGDIADIAIQGDIKPIQATVCKDDVEFALAVVEGNLKEGMPSSTETAVLPAGDASPEKDNERSESTEPDDRPHVKVQLELDMKLEEVSLTVMETVHGTSRPRLAVEVAGLATSVCMRPFDLQAKASMTYVNVKDFTQHAVDGGPMLIVASERETDLLAVEAVVAKPEGPEFKSQFNQTKTKLGIAVSALLVNAHLQTLTELQRFAEDFIPERLKHPAPPTDVIDIPLPSADETAAKTPSAESPTPIPAQGVSADVIDLSLDAKLRQFSVVVSSGQMNLARLDVENVAASLEMSPAKLTAEARLKSLLVSDTYEKTNFPKIVSASSDQEILYVKFDQFKEVEGPADTPLDPDHVDMSVYVRLASVEVIFLNRFVQSMLVFLQEFQAAQEMMALARNKASEAAAASVEVLKEQQAKRIKLDIVLRSPVITAPSSSTSTSSVRVNLGVLTVKNDLSLVDDSDAKVLLDTMAVAMTDVSVTRASQVEGGGVARRSLLKPVDIKVDIQRCLTQGDFTIPAVKIVADLPDVQVHIGQTDLGAVLRIVQGNLQEMPSIEASQTSDSSARPLSPSPSAVSATSAQSGSKSQPKPETDATGVVNPERLTLDATFSLGKIYLGLYQNEPDLVAGSGVDSVHDAKHLLAAFAINTVKGSAMMKASGYLEAKATLSDVTLDDCRKERQGRITRMICKRPVSAESLQKGSLVTDINSLLAVNVEKHSSGDVLVVASVNGIQAIVYLDFLLVLAEFAKSAVEEVTDELDDEDDEDLSDDEEDGPDDSRSTPHRSRPQSSAAVVEEEEIFEDHPLRISLHINSVEALLVENADDLDSRAIGLKVAGDVLINRNFGQMNIAGHLSRFAVETLRLEHQDLSVDVLEPTSVELNLSQTSSGSMQISTTIPAVVIKIDPNFVTLLTGALRTLQERQGEEGEKPVKEHSRRTSQRKAVVAPRSLWAPRLVNKKRWYYIRGRALQELESHVEEEMATLDVDEADASTAVHRRSETLDVTIHRIEVVLQYDAAAYEFKSYKAGASVRPSGSSSSVPAPGSDDTSRLMVPLLGLQVAVSGSVSDWSGDMTATMDITVQSSYFNRRLAVWEPIIEPIELVTDSYRPYQLTAKMVLNKPDEDDDDDSDDDMADTFLKKPNKKRKRYKKGRKRAREVIRRNRKAGEARPAEMQLFIDTDDFLQLTVTKTSIQVLQLVAEVYGEAVGKIGSSDDFTDSSLVKKTVGDQYAVSNKLEVDILVRPGPSFTNHGKDQVVVASKRMNMSLTRDAIAQRLRVGSSDLASQDTSQTVSDTIKLKVCGSQRGMPDFESFLVPIHRCGRFYYVLPYKGGRAYGIIVQVDLVGAQKKVTIRAPLEIHNHIDHDLQVYCRDSTGGKPQLLCTLPPEDKFIVPLGLTVGTVFQMSPQDDNFTIAEPPCSWNTPGESVRVEAKGKRGGVFGLRVRKEEEQVSYTGRDNLKSLPHHVLHVHPILTLQNLLPYPLCYKLEGNDEYQILQQGARHHLYVVQQSAITVHAKVEDYFFASLEGSFSIEECKEKHFTPLPMTVVGQADSQQKTVQFSVEYSLVDTLEVAVYVDYWIINQSHQLMEIKPYDTMPKFFGPLASAEKTPVMFGFKKKGKAKVELKVGKSKPSASFSMDTAGSEGRLLCVENDTTYELGVKVVLSHFNLTKLVYFTPYNLICNYSKIPVVAADLTGMTVELEPDAVKPFYPTTGANIVRIIPSGCDKVLKDVSFSKSGTTLLQVNKESVLVVSVDVSNAVTVITIDDYFNGAAPARIENYCAKTSFTLRQKDDDYAVTLGPNSEYFYSWNKPTGERKLVWSTSNGDAVQTAEEDLMENNRGDFMSPGGLEFDGAEGKIYWTLLIDGLQRVLLFTPVKYVADTAYESDLVENVKQEISLDLPGIGVSLVNNLTATEVLYMGITSSGAIWQVDRGKDRWKTLTVQECLKVEEVHDGKKPPAITGDVQLKKEGTELVMIKPHKGRLRRSFNQGVSFRLTRSDHQTKVHASINRVQIDNQLFAAGFPGVLFPMPPPKTVALQTAPKPFIEFSFMQNTSEDGAAKQIKYMVLLVQAMHVKVDIGFVGALLEIFSTGMDPSRRALQVEHTMGLLEGGLSDTAAVRAVQKDARTFYDYVHLSPLKVMISFSLHNADKVLLNTRNPLVELLVSLLHSIGSTLTDQSDTQLKMAFFEVDSEVMTQTQLVKSITDHYKTQAINQLYVFLLGLDVLGNPFGLVRGFKDGVVDLFYEPYQGAVQGPEEFAEGLLLGGRSFVGASVGGLFGAVGRIAGAIGGGFARLTLDDKFIEERRRRQAEPKDAIGGVVEGGKGLVMGLFDGVTGLVRKPVEGAMAEGAEGFFKGVGKGLLGVVVRPVGGVLDFAGSTFEGIKKQIELSDDEWRRLRARRYLVLDGAVTPYNTALSLGNAILGAVRRSESLDEPLGDFKFQQLINALKDKQYIFLVTSRYMMVLELPYSFLNSEEYVKPEWSSLLSDLIKISALPGPAIEVLHKVKPVTVFSSSKSQKKFMMPTPDAAKNTVRQVQSLTNTV